MFKIILNKLETLKPSLMESAYDLGASKFQAFWYVLLPNIKLSLIIAGLLAFTISLDETLITLFLIGNDTTWPIKLWAKMRVGFSKQVNASVTLILILTSLLVLLIASIISKSEKRLCINIMDKRLKDKKAIVTGGSRGIGEGIVKRLYDEGCHVIIADIRKELAENLISSLSKDQISFFKQIWQKKKILKN